MGDVLSTVVGASQDPYLSEVICRVEQLQSIDKKQPVKPCVKTRPGLPGGIGLRRTIQPLRAYVYAEQRPWVYPVAVAAIVGLPLFIGYQLGKG
jgi:hypothetical protein